VSAWRALSATVTIYSATCIVLYMHRSVQWSHSEHAMPCESSTDFRTTDLVGDNLTVTVIIRRRLPPIWLTTPRITPPAHRRGRLDADLRGGWTQIFDVKASEPETSRPVVKRNFIFLTCISRSDRNFVGSFAPQLLCAIVPRFLRNPTFSRFGLTPTCDRRTDSRTDIRNAMTANRPTVLVYSFARLKLTIESSQ